MRELLVKVHIGLGYLLAAYTLYVLKVNPSSKQLSAEARAALLEKLQRLLRLASYVALVAFLIGGYLATPYFKSGQIWVYFKLLLFLALMAVMGALGSKSIRSFQQLSNPLDVDSPQFLRAARMFQRFKWLQFAVVGLLFLVAYWKPF
ncbi:MAG: hypothetical protein D6715_12950 [Calditrichaeota bacterium]|nr:MAG: hypothetical protein D6715_12950 [Calditrichota bacterium]